MTVLVQTVVGFQVLRPVVLVLLVVWLAAVFPAMRATERGFLAAAAASAIVIVAVGADWRSLLGTGLDRATDFVALLVALGLLRDAARTSRAVRRAGNWLIRQSPTWRFLAIAVGGHGFGIALNMGAVTLLGTLIKRANTLEAAGGDAEVVAIREERMNVALLQGFFSMLVWSPMAISVAFTLSMIPSVTWFDIAPPALAIAVLFLATGWAVDRIKWPPTRRRSIPQPGPKPPVRDALPMLGIIVGLVSTVLGAKAMLSLGMLEAITWFAGMFALGWFVVQYARFGIDNALASTLGRLNRHVVRFVPDSRGEQIVLGAASFLGVTLATLLQNLGASALLDSWNPPGVLLALAIVLFIVVGSQFGVVALVTSAIAGGAVMGMAKMPLTPLELVLSLQVGWSISATLSAYSGGTMLMARIIDRDPSIFRRWNMPWAVVCFLLYAAIAWWRI
ncbi:MAG: hypothetical protein HY059_00930 [Proteobacteria bacterium]|nr:hypothetical protein [Pseudomonadota bacterium]